MNELSSEQMTPIPPADAEVSAQARSPILLVELTGGEPLLQPDAVGLAQRLMAENYTVLVETSGERFVGALPRKS